MPSIINPLKTALVGISAANPIIGFVFKYWKILAIMFLLLSVSTILFAGWKYHQYMTAQIVKLTSDLTQYKGQVSVLDANIQKIMDDVKIAEEQRKNFDQSIVEIKKSNSTLRFRINALRNVAPTITGPTEQIGQTEAVDQQSVINSLRDDIANKWTTIHEGDQK